MPGHAIAAAFAQRHPGRLTLVTRTSTACTSARAAPGVLALHGNIADDKWLRAAATACCAQATAGRAAAALRHLRQPAPAGGGLVRRDAADSAVLAAAGAGGRSAAT